MILVEQTIFQLQHDYNYQPIVCCSWYLIHFLLYCIGSPLETLYGQSMPVI